MRRRFFLVPMEPQVDVQPLPTDVPTTGEPAAKADGEEVLPIDLPEGLTANSVLDYCRERNKSHESAYKEKFKQIVRQSEMYENRTTNRVKSNKIINYPTLFGIIETIYSRLVPAIFNKPKYVEMAPDFFTTDNEAVLLVDDFVNQKLMWACRAIEKSKQLIKSLVIEGTCVVESVWKIKAEKRTHPTYELGKYVGDQVEDEEIQKWDFTVGNILNYAWDPNMTESSRLQDSLWARKRSFISLNELYKWQEDGRIEGVDEIEKMVPESVTRRGEGEVKNWEAKRLEALGQKRSSYAAYGNEKEYLFEEWYGFVIWKQYDEDGTCVHQTGNFHWYVVENKHLVMFEENQLTPQRIPWASAPGIVALRDVCGKGIGEAIENLYDQINTYAGKQADNINQIANPVTYYDRTSGLNGRAAFMKQEGLVPVDNAKGIYRPPIDTNGVKALQAYINFIIQMARDTTGATEQAQGTEGADTATEFQGLVANAMSRFSDAVSNVENFIIKFLGEECLLFYQQFGQDNLMFVRKGSVEDGNCVQLTRQQIQGRYECIPTSSQDQANKMAMLNMSNKFVQMIAEAQGQNPMIFGNKRFDLGKFVIERILTLFNVPNGKEFLVDNPPAPAPGMPGLPGLPPGQGLPGPGMPTPGPVPGPQPSPDMASLAGAR